MKGAVHQQPQDVGVHWLFIKVVSAERDGFHGTVAIVVAGDHDHLGRGREAKNLLQRLYSLTDAVGIGRQPQVLQHNWRGMTPQLRQSLGAIGRRDDFVLVETPFELRLQAQVVFDDQ